MSSLTCGHLIELLQTQNPETPVELVDTYEENFDVKLVVQSAISGVLQLHTSRYNHVCDPDVLLYEAPK